MQLPPLGVERKNMFYLQFTIPGKAVAKQSFRYTKDGRKYTDKKVKAYAKFVKECFSNKFPFHLPSVFFEKPLALKTTAYIAVPKSFSKTKREQCLSGKIRPLVKPDTDNISKNIKDALNGLAYPDDRQVVTELTQKFYANESYTIVEIGDI